MAKNILTEYLRVNAQRIKLEKEEQKLANRIREALKSGETVKNHAKEAYLIHSSRRRIDAASFIEAFDLHRFSAVAEVSMKKVDALITLNKLNKKDVNRITRHDSIQPRIGTRSVK
jgi:hypothetical protein